MVTKNGYDVARSDDRVLGANPSLIANASESGSAPEYHLLRDLVEIEAIASCWERLLEQSPCNRAFSSSKWFLAWCRSYPKLAPFVVIARRGPELAAVLPLAVQEEQGTIDFPSPMCDYNDLVAGASDLAAQTGVLAFALAHAASYRIVLSNVRPDSNCRQAAACLAESKGLQTGYQPDKNCFYIQLSGTFAGYLATRSHVFRKGLGRIQRNAQSSGLEVRQLTPDRIPPDEMVELFLSLNLSRFESRSGFAPRPVQEFVREVLPSLFVEGKMAAFVLLHGARVLAIDVCMRGRNSLCSWNGGFLPEAAQWSPGRLLFAAGIEHAVSSGLEEYDLLRGSHAYKASWATHSRTIGPLKFNSQSCTDALAQHETKSAYCL
ncbi:MAG: GNAT family N-acetyltransferase [Acidobacteriia bacterium]|nr:GNAT family N-acetyltransferase [Terriglobia bacterium]